jgi:hypothetical protein
LGLHDDYYKKQQNKIKEFLDKKEESNVQKENERVEVS